MLKGLGHLSYEEKAESTGSVQPGEEKGSGGSHQCVGIPGGMEPGSQWYPVMGPEATD